jgi:hypothetical protein
VMISYWAYWLAGMGDAGGWLASGDGEAGGGGVTAAVAHPAKSNGHISQKNVRIRSNLLTKVVVL